MNVFSSYATNILTIRNFPLLFNDNDRQEFLEHFGAVRVRCLTRYKNLSNLIIADFGSSSQASQALTRLHQLEILARRLTVEYSSLELAHFAFSSDIIPYDENENNFLHGISPGKNQIYYSLPNERLSYSYPPIDDTILTNINNALLSVPAFYTQVLHLMNKMSLPCPMVADLNKNQQSLLRNSIACQTDESTFCKVINMDTDDDESEIDDGEEEERVKRRQRLRLQTSTHREVQPSTQLQTSIDVEKKKKPIIELKLPESLQYHMETNESTLTDPVEHGFGRFEPIQSTIEIIPPETQPLPPLPLIPLEEITKNRLTEDQLRLIDNGRLYRNYERGPTSRRLYIKNIDVKHVDERILHSIYDRYKSDSNLSIDVRLLREGKMKGQAFVSFPNEQIALNALNDTNGYVLFEKPLIVQFARSAKPKDIL